MGALLAFVCEDESAYTDNVGLFLGVIPLQVSGVIDFLAYFLFGDDQTLRQHIYLNLRERYSYVRRPGEVDPPYPAFQKLCA